MVEPGNIPPPLIDADELCLPRDQFLENEANNHFLDFDQMSCQYPIILEILRIRPLHVALSKEAVVPELYVQQLWRTLQYVSVNIPSASYFIGRVDNYNVRLTLSQFRRILSLLEVNTHENPSSNIVP